MVSRTYIFLLAVCALLVSATGAYFSVTGLVELFTGATKSVALMASSLELSKLVAVGFLYRFWGHIHHILRMYLIFAVCVLMLITSIGIYGYLSNAYQMAALDIHANDLEVQSLEQENARIEARITELQEFVDKIPESRVSRKAEFQKAYDPQIRKLHEQAEANHQKLNEYRQRALNLKTKVGPVFFLARTFGLEADTVVKYLILLFVSVFDPLAVSLVFGLNLILRLREKYRGNEYKIGAQSLTTPVDHRFKKAG